MLQNLKIGARLAGGFGVVVLLTAIIGILAILSITSLSGNVARLSEENLPKVEATTRVTNNVNVVARAIRNILLFDKPEARAQEAERITKASGEVTSALELLEAKVQSDKGKQLLGAVKRAREEYLPLRNEVMGLGAQGKTKEAVELLAGKFRSAQAAYLDSVEALARHETSLAKLEGKAAVEGAASARTMLLVALGAAILASVLIATWIARSISVPIASCVEVARRVAAGDTSVKLDSTRGDEIGVLQLELGRLVENIQAVNQELRTISAAAANGQLSQRGDATRHRGDFQVVVQGVNAMLDSVTGPLAVAADYVARIGNGDIPPKIRESYNGDFNTIKNNLNTCIDAVNALTADAAMLSKAAVEGKLETRADAGKHQGDFRKIVQGVNETLDAVIGPLNVAANYVDRISKGDIPPKITDKYNGDFNTIKNNLNTCVDAVTALVNDASMLSVAAVEGKLATRADASKHHGDYRKIVKGVNDTLDAVIGPLNVAANYVDRISKGDIPPRITDSYHGDFNNIKNNLNTCIDAVNAMTGDAAMLSKAAVEGKLATRADATKHRGDFQKIVKGVNDTLDAVIGPLNVAANYVDRISKGDIPARITDSYNGDFNLIKSNLNTCIDAVTALVADANLLSRAAVEGKLDTRADATRHQGDFRKVVSGVNDTLDAVLAPVTEAMGVLVKLADRDMRARVTSNFQGDHAKLKETTNSMAAALEDALSQVSEAVEQISSAAGQITVGSQSVAQGASEQASSLEETSASMEEMGSMTQQNADNTHQAKVLADGTKAAADKGAKAMSTMLASMGQIRTAAENTANIIRDINEIAFQTNLLALNAAVEAARAGDAGRGFAVVAEEVRSLAQRAKEAAKKTEELIQESVRLAGQGQHVSEEVNGGLTEIIESVNKVTHIVNEIAVASTEQSRGIQAVNKALGEMDKVTQQNAANAEESSSAAEELAGQSQELAAMVSRFKLTRVTRASSNGAAKKAPGMLPAARKSTSNGARKSRAEEVIPFDDDDADLASF